MKLFFLRHGIAEEYRPGGSDSDRELTTLGIEEARREAQALKQLDLKLGLILTSPYKRARKTAEIVADILERPEILRIEERLAPGFRMGDLQQIVLENSETKRLMLVGHNFDLPHVAGQLIGGAHLQLSKGGLIRIDAERIEPGGGTLEWLLTPTVLIGKAV